MRYPNRQVLVLATLLIATSPAHAQSAFPGKPVRLVSSTTAGGQPDTIARMIAQKMSEHWGRPIIMDNRPGAGGMLAANLVAKAAPDGHTLLYVLPNFVITPAMQPNVTYDALKDFAGIAQIGVSTNVLVVTPALNVKTLKEFIALAKSQTGKLIFGSGATGTAGHISGASLGLIAGIKVIHVAFKGGPDAAIEVLAGRSHYTVSTMGVALPFLNEKKLVALAVLSPQRAPVLPDVPTLSELQGEFKRPEISHGLLAPAGTPRTVLHLISKEVARVLALPDIKERLQAISFVTTPTAPEVYDQILRDQLETTAKLVNDLGMRPR